MAIESGRRRARSVSRTRGGIGGSGKVKPWLQLQSPSRTRSSSPSSRKRMVRARLRREHPGWSEGELDERVHWPAFSFVPRRPGRRPASRGRELAESFLEVVEKAPTAIRATEQRRALRVYHPMGATRKPVAGKTSQRAACFFPQPEATLHRATSRSSLSCVAKPCADFHAAQARSLSPSIAAPRGNGGQ